MIYSSEKETLNVKEIIETLRGKTLSQIYELYEKLEDDEQRYCFLDNLLRSYKKHKSWYQADKYLILWQKYVGLCEDREKLIDLMVEQEIGTQILEFYIYMGGQLNKDGHFAKQELLYQRGIERVKPKAGYLRALLSKFRDQMNTIIEGEKPLHYEESGHKRKSLNNIDLPKKKKSLATTIKTSPKKPGLMESEDAQQNSLGAEFEKIQSDIKQMSISRLQNAQNHKLSFLRYGHLPEVMEMESPQKPVTLVLDMSEFKDEKPPLLRDLTNLSQIDEIQVSQNELDVGHIHTKLEFSIIQHLDDFSNNQVYLNSQEPPDSQRSKVSKVVKAAQKFNFNSIKKKTQNRFIEIDYPSIQNLRADNNDFIDLDQLNDPDDLNILPSQFNDKSLDNQYSYPQLDEVKTESLCLSLSCIQEVDTSNQNIFYTREEQQELLKQQKKVAHEVFNILSLIEEESNEI